MRLSSGILRGVLVVLGFLVMTSDSRAQVPPQTRTVWAKVISDIDLLNENLQIKSQTQQSFAGDNWSAKAELEDGVLALEDVNVALKQGEIQISYRVNYELDDEQNRNQFISEVRLSIDGVQMYLHPDRFYGDFGVLGRAGPEVENQILITKFVESALDLQGELIVELIVTQTFDVSLNFEFDCGAEPRFTFGQKIPYIAGAVVGAGLLTWGVIEELDAQDKYDIYKSQVDSDNELFNDANEQHKNAQYLLWAGGIVLAADAVLYSLRQRDYNRRKRTYDKYCKYSSSSPISMVPGIRMERITGSEATVALAWKYPLN